MNQQEYNNYLYGQKVALVGPASSIVHSAKGEFIDSCDVVARVGCPLPITNPADQGIRTDVIYENFWDFRKEFKTDKEGIVNLWCASGVKVIINVYPRHEGTDAFERINAGRLSVIHQDDNWFNSLLPSPSKGICAIEHLLQREITHLYVAGFTFDMQYSAYAIANNLYHFTQQDMQNIEENKIDGDHKFMKELERFKYLASTDPRLTYDEALDNIMRGCK